MFKLKGYYPSAALLLTLFLFFSLILAACRTEGRVKVEQTPARTQNGYHVIIEIPAGTNLKIEYNKADRKFEPDQVNGQDRIIEFLPYPGNYGFIPSTLMDEARGGDGDPLDVLVIASSVPTGSLMEVELLGALKLRDQGELDTKLIALPLEKEDRIIQPDDFQDFLIRYDEVRRIIEQWFTAYKGRGQVEMLGWEDEQFAKQEVARWEK